MATTSSSGGGPNAPTRRSSTRKANTRSSSSRSTGSRSTGSRSAASRSTSGRKTTARKSTGRRTATSRRSARTTVTSTQPRTAAGHVQLYAERAVLVPVGASLLARDNFVATVSGLVTKYRTRNGVERELKIGRAHV